jgi:hypothetical protein
MRFAKLLGVFSLVAGFSVTAGLGVAVLTAPAASASTPCGSSGAYSVAAGVDTCQYTATGEDTFAVPAGVVQVSVVAIGGAGGAGGQDLDGTFALIGSGGLGAAVTADLDVTPATTLYVEVGGDGGNASGNVAGGTCATGAGGENGGAPGGYTSCGGESGGGGGGASDVQTCSIGDETCLSSVNAGSGDPRLVVAGGGGGGGGVYVSSLVLPGLGGSAGAASAGTGAGNGGGCDSTNYAGDNGGDSGTGSGGGDGGVIYGFCLGLGFLEPGSDGSAGEGGMTFDSSLGGGGGGGGGGYIGGGSGATVFTGGGGGAGSSFGPAGVTAVASEASPSVSISWTTTPCGAPVITGSTAVVTCSYDGTNGTDGTPQTWTVPTGVTQATFDAGGGQGGSFIDALGGLGGEAQGTFTVSPGDTYDIVAAGAGQEEGQTSANNPGAGGYGGGGAGGANDYGPGDGGGGASSVALSGDLLVVAGGGGGSSPGCATPALTPCGTGGAGGGTDGDAGTSIGGTDAGQGGAGGTQSGPGVGADGAGSGSTLQGGGGETSDFALSGGGGGGGYFGGAGGGASAGGGGGSGYVDSSASSSSQQTGVQSGNGVVTITYQLPLASPSITSLALPASVTLSNEGETLIDEAILAGGNAPTGTITFNLFYDGSAFPVETQYVTVSGDGIYSVPYDLPTDQTVTGSYQWDLSYSGDDQNNGAADNGDPAEAVTVSPATPTLVTTPSPLLATIGNTPTTLTDSATLAGGYYPTGTINFSLFYDGGATPVDTESVTVEGNGTYVTPEGYTLPQGTNTVVGAYQWDASYGGDGNNIAASDGDIHEAAFVSPGSEPTSTSLAVAHPSVTYGSSTTEAFSGLVTGQANDGYPEGSVNVTYGPSATLLCNTPLTGGSGDSASYSCPASSLLAAGNYSDVVATYVPSGSSSSNANFLYQTSTSSPAKSFNVSKDTTATSVSVAASLVTFGNESVAMFSVKVTTHNGEAVPTGEKVTVVAGLTNCVATLTAGSGTCWIANTALPAGAYPVGASYPGDGNLVGSIGVANSLLLVGRDSTVTSVTETPAGLTYGHETVALFSVKVTTHYGETVPIGEHVVVTAGPASCVATLTAGTGTCGIANAALGVGTYPVVATYLVDGNLSGSSASLATRIAVAQDTTSTAVSASGTSAVLGHESSVLFSVVVTTHYGETVPNGEHATVHVSSANCTVTLVSGHGSCALANNALGVGTYSVSASYGGDTNLINSTVTSTSSFSVKI